MTKQMNDETSSSIGFRKETITIDVPEGKEIDWDLVMRNNSETPLSIYVIYFKDREICNEYVDVRKTISTWL